MKILFVNEYSTARAVSGAEYSTQELAKALKVEIYSPPWKKNKVGLALTPSWFNNPIYWVWAAYHITCAVRNKKIDLIHVHGKYIQSSSVIAGWLTGKPVITTVRDFKFLCPLALCFLHQHRRCTWKNYLNQEIPEYLNRYGKVSVIKLVLAKLLQLRMKWWLNCSAAVIAVSPQLKKIYEENGIRRVTSIYNLPPTLRRSRRPSKGITLLSVGKLSYGKGTDTILEAAKLLPDYQFIFVGELNPSLRQAFPKNCRYLGKVSHEQTTKLYQQADVFVINSRWPEPLSRAGLEALSFGLPIVASDRGGNKELVKNNGFLVDPDSPKTLVNAIKQAIQDRTMLGKNSLKLLVTRFNRKKIIANHIQLYQSLSR